MAKETKKKVKKTSQKEASKPAEQQTLTAQVKEEVAKWQTKMDEAKVQMNLAGKEARDKIEPQVKKIEAELSQAEKDWEKLESASESAWKDIHSGLKRSISTMQKSFDKAKDHFKEEKETK
jgi:hypothetical protein